MTNHFHLMLEPLQNDILSQAMESILKPYALYFNKRYNRTGHVFESRFKSYIIQTESYFFSCCRYINLNPVKAKMVTSPEKYMWSGFLSLANRQKDLVKMDHHELYLALGKSPEERKNAYSVLIRHQNDDYENRIKTGRTVIGNRNFKQQIKNLLSEH
jgi:putative transposase